MALLVDDNTGNLVQNLWPTEFRRFADDPTDYAECQTWQAVPCNEVELSEWLQIIPNPVAGDRSRPYTVTHVPDVEDGNEDGAELYELAVRFTGFLERFNLGPLGNWNGTEQGAVKAVQSIVLSGGGYDKQWSSTTRALNRLMTVVAKMVKPEDDVEAPFDESGTSQVFMQRRVFVKANSESSFNIPPGVAHRGPELRSIGKSWHLDDHIDFAQLSREGTLKHATNVIFRPGHFVEVTAYVEIAMMKNGHIRMQLRPDRVVLVSTEGLSKGRFITPNPAKVLKRRTPILDVDALDETGVAGEEHDIVMA